MKRYKSQATVKQQTTRGYVGLLQWRPHLELTALQQLQCSVCVGGTCVLREVKAGLLRGPGALA